jgi:hypothetical protein
MKTRFKVEWGRDLFEGKRVETFLLFETMKMRIICESIKNFEG